MRLPRSPFICPQCRLVQLRPRRTAAISRPFHNSIARFSSTKPTSPDSNITTTTTNDAPTTPPPPPRPTTAPKPNVDIKHIRQNAALYEQNCLERNYRAQAAYPGRIVALFEEFQARQRAGRGLRERGNLVRRRLANPASIQHEGDEEGVKGKGTDGDKAREDAAAAAAAAVRAESRDALLEEARDLKRQLAAIEDDEARLQSEMEALALSIPNLTHDAAPRGEEPRVLGYINGAPEDLHPEESTPSSSSHPSSSSSDRVWRSHVHIGAELGILDFAGAAASSGWGWYYLLDEGAQLEQALVQYALSAVAGRQPPPSSPSSRWRRVSPPSVVYGHVAAACGFQPRDQHGEQQVYGLARSAADAARGRPELCLAGTAEIPLAALRADSVFEAASELPLKLVGASRCYRAEAGARGADTKGLYRVHEFTKVEMFAWAPAPADEGETPAPAEDVFNEMIDIQKEILRSLGLRCRVLEMPTADLGASATRKCDIEAYFPSRAGLPGGGWGEVTSASICGDYQTRRLATRARAAGGRLTYPWTVNGTALAVPRVLAALLENGWDEEHLTVTIPECLRPWMDGKDKIGPKHHPH